MNSKTQLAIVALLVGFATFLILSKSMWWKDAATGDSKAVDQMRQDLAGMKQELAALRDAMQSARADFERLSRRQTDLSRAADTPSIAKPAADGAPERAGEQTAGVTARPASRSGDTAGAISLETALAGVTDKSMSWEDREKLWKRIREAGLTDAVIAELEKRVAAKPKDPDAQTELGNAYLKKLQEVPQGPESGVWATKADQAFDKALEIDPEHWDSRFMKAVSLSFWPAALGKGPEAIKNFETLMNQQERQTPHQGFESTYYFLGNMYLQAGQRDQAIATWQRGLRVFPDNTQLQQQLAHSR
jgi:tetratricopeptide (TPR) repeat protein